jgi:hypothetical protein
MDDVVNVSVLGSTPPAVAAWLNVSDVTAPAVLTVATVVAGLVVIPVPDTD